MQVKIANLKRLTFWQKIVYAVNVVAATALLIGYVLPFVPPHWFPLLPIISLGLPVLIIVNFLFAVYWLIKLKRAVLLSGIVLCIGITYVQQLFQFNSGATIPAKALSVLSYNVKGFRKNGNALAQKTVTDIYNFIKSKNPDVVCLQEYRGQTSLDKNIYPYSYEKLTVRRLHFGQKIYSKYPIIASGSLNFKSATNNAIYVDILKQTDTIRIYNVHFESLRIAANVTTLQQQNSERLLKRVGSAFVKQEKQALLLKSHIQNSLHPVIIAGDFNNRSSSYLYRQILDDRLDAFLEVGEGVGATFNFDFLPIRIDFLFSDREWEPVFFDSYKVNFSDHYPILGKFSK